MTNGYIYRIFYNLFLFSFIIQNVFGRVERGVELVQPVTRRATPSYENFLRLEFTVHFNEAISGA